MNDDDIDSEEEEEEERPMLSLVWLLKQPRSIEVATLKPVVEEAWGIEFATDEIDPQELEEEAQSDETIEQRIERIFSEDDDDDDSLFQGDDENENMIVGAPPVFMIHADSQMFNLNSMPMPYIENAEEVADDTPDTRLKKILTEHQGWISVDYLFAVEEEESDVDEDAIYERIGKLMAELANEDCLALVCPETEQIIPYSPEVAERLKEPDPLAVFEEMAQFPVVNVADDDPRMAAAVAEARRRWPEFLQAFEKRYPGQQFAVKAPVTSDGTTEFIWVEVVGIGGQVVFGTLANDPVDLPGHKFGDQLEIEFDTINDWLFTEGDDVTGLFTAKVLKAIADDVSGENS